jgi:acyl-CoA synthetase (AMP-forming)/AMP-acid ligase II
VPPLFPALTDSPADRPALRFGERSLTYAQLAAAAGALTGRIGGATRVAVWATPTMETAVAVVAALLAGVPAVPLNPKSGEKELGHILSDSAPELVLTAPDDLLPTPLRDLTRVDVDVHATGPAPEDGPSRAPWTRWPTPGSGAATTSSSTDCRCSMCTAWFWASSARCGAADRCGTWAASAPRASPAS